MTGPGVDDPDATEYDGEFAVAHTVLAVVVGEPAGGLADPDLATEVRRRGVFVPPTELFWQFDKPPDTVAGPGLDRISWEVERFCAAGLRGEPAALEVLGSPLVETCTPVGAELRELTRALLSQRIADAYRRATATEFARASAAMAARGTPRWPQLAEVIRLLIVAERALRTGELDIDVSAYAPQLLAVAAGELAWP
jgi:uncharacterized protein